MEILLFYGVKLTGAIQMKLDNYVILPEKRSTAASTELCLRLNQLNRQFDLEPSEKMEQVKICYFCAQYLYIK